MTKIFRTWQEFMIEQLAEEEDMSGLLSAIMEEYQSHGNAAVIQICLETIVEAKGGITEFAKKTDIDPQVLSDVLTKKETLHIDTLTIVLNAIGCRLSIVSLDDVDTDIAADASIGTSDPHLNIDEQQVSTQN